MTCGFLDLICQVQNAGDSLITWLLGFISLGFLAGLVLGSILGAKYGWAAVVSLGLSALAVVMARRREPDAYEHVSDDDVPGTVFRKPVRRTAKREPVKGPKMPPEALG